MNSGNLGRDAGNSLVIWAIACRIKAASLVPVARAARCSEAFNPFGRYTVVFSMPYTLPYVGVPPPEPDNT